MTFIAGANKRGYSYLFSDCMLSDGNSPLPYGHFKVGRICDGVLMAFAGEVGHAEQLAAELHKSVDSGKSMSENFCAIRALVERKFQDGKNCNLDLVLVSRDSGSSKVFMISNKKLVELKEGTFHFGSGSVAVGKKIEKLVHSLEGKGWIWGRQGTTLLNWWAIGDKSPEGTKNLFGRRFLYVFQTPKEDVFQPNTITLYCRKDGELLKIYHYYHFWYLHSPVLMDGYNNKESIELNPYDYEGVKLAEDIVIAGRSVKQEVKEYSNSVLITEYSVCLIPNDPTIPHFNGTLAKPIRFSDNAQSMPNEVTSAIQEIAQKCGVKRIEYVKADPSSRK